MKLRNALLTLIGIFAIGGSMLFVRQLRTHGLSARAKPTAVEVWLARHVRDLATPSAVKNRKNPVEVTPLVLAEARDHFADHCATCHGNKGDGKTMLGNGMYPPPPDLREQATQALTDGEIFNIIENGIRFTGMPGFGVSDDANWKLVLFVRHLPNLSEKEVEFMTEINGQGAQNENNAH